MPLPKGSTVASVAHLLAHKDDYVRRALINFRPEFKKNPEAVLTIGLIGNGSHPNYRIDQPLHGRDIHDGTAISVGWPELAFNGRSHKALVDPKQLKLDNWSEASMTYLELELLLGRMRGLK